MTWPPPHPRPLPPPAPPISCPRLRGLLARYFTWLDRRKTAALSARWQLAQDAAWRDRYAAWWLEHGWRQGADTPDVALLKLQASRRLS